MSREGWEQKLSKIMHTGSFAYDDILNFIRRIAAQERQAGRKERDLEWRAAVESELSTEAYDNIALKLIVAAARSPKDGEMK
jgi:hypothetical protein